MSLEELSSTKWNEDGARDSIDNYYNVVRKLKKEYGNKFVPPEKLLEVINSIKDPDLFIPYIFSPDDVRNAMPAKGSEYTNEMNMNIIPIRDWGGKDNICSIEFFMAVATIMLAIGITSRIESCSLRCYYYGFTSLADFMI